MELNGSLPPGAVRAVVIDDRGDEVEATVEGGTWSAEATAAERLVRYLDAAGELVPQPLPPGPRRPVDDAPEPCPVCAARAWTQIGAVVACERCGFALASQTVVAAASVVFEAVDDEASSAYEAQADEWRAALARTAFPVYRVPGHPVSLMPNADGILAAQGIGTGLLLVVCSAEQPSADDAAALLRTFASAAAYDESWSDAAAQVHGAHAEREARRLVARAEPRGQVLIVDGAPEPFVVTTVKGAWMALAERLPLALVAQGVAPARVELERIADLTDPNPAPPPPKPRGLLTRAEVSALVDRCGLGEHREAIVGSIRPAYRLEPADESPHRLGGEADLADGEAWPHDERGVPQTLVAQIDCSALPSLESEFSAPTWTPGNVLLRIFAELDLLDPEPGRGVALTCPADAPLTRTPVPPRPDPLPPGAEWFGDDDSLRVLKEVPVRLVPTLTVASQHLVAPGADWETFARFQARLAGGGPERESAWQDAQLLGHAETEQGEDVRYAGPSVYRDGSADEDWAVLLNLPSHPGLSFGDGGTLSIAIGVADLAAGRYDRLATEKTMG